MTRQMGDHHRYGTTIAKRTIAAKWPISFLSQTYSNTQNTRICYTRCPPLIPMQMVNDGRTFFMFHITSTFLRSLAHANNVACYYNGWWLRENNLLQANDSNEHSHDTIDSVPVHGEWEIDLLRLRFVRRRCMNSLQKTENNETNTCVHASYTQR